MRVPTIVLLLLILVSMAAPAMAAKDERYSYITVEDVKIKLDNGTAIINVNYSVDEGTRFIFFLLGKQDLKNKLITILNYDDAQMRHINLSNAEFVVPQAAFSYGRGIYWYPSHNFNVFIPKLSVQTPQVTRNFTDINQFPDGIGYFSVESSMPS
ncbi:MAG: hypothetical protein NTZ39_00135 [Methanoregula sp.]|nr:hypothetical protein [Methanoregula sp.]